ncbi:hypothetical protein OIE13_22215 [Streptosporangium sp. NBC_01810]|uniref:hypothetical protein n=1 Tax=Streptosporangium sp. NBC_01810 TaxID=2975951 RepID=UPI002DDBF2E0|nr:hypothetical protein [Streptosporangium sp. NBC_01810]WSA23658.1 hypothetical protein OIE13_22215 [Streptosporangium sp. NBC_01810]
MTPDGLETVTYITPRGSKVTLPFLTVEQRDAAVENLSPAAPPPEPVTAAKGDTCSNCAGAGGYNEQREQKTAGGGTVVVEVWVSCRPCKGNGTR